MIVGIVTLISVLFFGGGANFFPVQEMEKGISKYVEDQTTKKNLKSEIKAYKISAKKIRKEQEGLKKELVKLESNYDTSVDDFNVLRETIMETGKVMQDLAMDTRLRLVTHISAEEWEKIVELSITKTSKSLEKQAKKKQKDPFTKVEASVEGSITDTSKRSNVMEALDNFRNTFVELHQEIESKNVIDTEVLSDQGATREEMQQLADAVNSIRERTFDAAVDFHFMLKANTTQIEFKRIIKEFNKVWK